MCLYCKHFAKEVFLVLHNTEYYKVRLIKLFELLGVDYFK